MVDGPPCMNRKMTRLARAANMGAFRGEGIGNGALSGQYGAEAQQAEARSGVLKDFATGAKRHSGYSLVERLYIEVMVGE